MKRRGARRATRGRCTARTDAPRPTVVLALGQARGLQGPFTRGFFGSSTRRARVPARMTHVEVGKTKGRERKTAFINAGTKRSARYRNYDRSCDETISNRQSTDRRLNQAKRDEVVTGDSHIFSPGGMSRSAIGWTKNQRRREQRRR